MEFPETLCGYVYPDPECIQVEELVLLFWVELDAWPSRLWGWAGGDPWVALTVALDTKFGVKVGKKGGGILKVVVVVVVVVFCSPCLGSLNIIWGTFGDAKPGSVQSGLGHLPVQHLADEELGCCSVKKWVWWQPGFFPGCVGLCWPQLGGHHFAIKLKCQWCSWLPVYFWCPHFVEKIEHQTARSVGKVSGLYGL